MLLAGANDGIVARQSRLLEQYEAEWRALDRASAVLEASFAWLHRHVNQLTESKTLIHGDLGFHNILVNEGRLTALLDWEHVSVGSPAQDLGYIWHAAIQLGDWQTFLNDYCAAGAVLPTREDLAFFILWASVWRTTLTLRVTAAFENGHLRGPNWGYISSYLQQRELQMLARKLDHVLRGQL
jgi:aminoglycoside phosphotransferase (APT) family kinase protein